MIRGQKVLAAPCGLYCGACRVYVADRRSDKKHLGQIAKDIASRRGRLVELSDLACDGCL